MSEKKLFWLDEDIEDFDNWGRANLHAQTTGIGRMIWIEQPLREELRNSNIMRLYISPNHRKGDLISNACMIRFNRFGKILKMCPNIKGKDIPEKIKQNLEVWINLNIGFLIQYWLDGLWTEDFCQLMIKLPKNQR